MSVVRFLAGRFFHSLRQTQHNAQHPRHARHHTTTNPQTIPHRAY